MSSKHIEKLEVVISELKIKIEELNCTIVDISSHKQRLHSENIELIKNVQDFKVQLDHVSHTKTQILSQYEDTRRRLEDEERRRSMIESTMHSIETELDSVRLQLEEESEARIDMERQLIKMQGEAQGWQNKYQSEAASHVEEVEELRRKYTVRITELEEHIESIIVKVNNLEKQRSRLSSEVEILIIDLEKSNNSCRELTKSVTHLEKVNIEIKSRLDETVLMYETAQRDLRVKSQDIQRLNHDLDKTKDANGQLARENKKLGGMIFDSVLFERFFSWF